MDKKIFEKIYDLVGELDYNEIETLFDKVCERKSSEEGYEKVEVVDEEEERKKKEFIQLANEIFDLCPNCNCIPLAVEHVVGSDYITTVAWDDVYTYTEETDFSSWINDDEHYVSPVEVMDDVKIGDWKKVIKKWQEMIKKSGLKNETDRGDYCEFIHNSFYVYSKKTDKIEYLPD